MWMCMRMCVFVRFFDSHSCTELRQFNTREAVLQRSAQLDAKMKLEPSEADVFILCLGAYLRGPSLLSSTFVLYCHLFTIWFFDCKTGGAREFDVSINMTSPLGLDSKGPWQKSVSMWK